MDFFEQTSDKLKTGWVRHTTNFKLYIRRLLFPLYLFPLKLITYTTYYSVKFLFKLIITILVLIVEFVLFPFRSLPNFLKSIVYFSVILYLLFSVVVIVDYLDKEYGSIDKLFCGAGVSDKLKKSVVRIVGGESEGSGFFVQNNQILTNFHVIDGEPSPKIIFNDGHFITPTKIVGNKDADLAILTVEEIYPDLVYGLPDEISFTENESLISAGYPLGTDIAGDATIVKGNFIDIRTSKYNPVGYIQTNLSLVAGMSGGPLVDQCGSVVGINTLSLAGLSLFITATDANNLIPSFTDQNIQKIQVDASKSPEDAVTAFYTYLKARRMQDGFNLLSKKYLEKTNFSEWTARFTNILDVQIYIAKIHENTKDTVFVKFATKNWVDGEAEWHYYEGTWKVVMEDGVYKMLQSKISEVMEPEWDWYYD